MLELGDSVAARVHASNKDQGLIAGTILFSEHSWSSSALLVQNSLAEQDKTSTVSSDPGAECMV